MFGFKSKRVKKLEAEKYILECELRDMKEGYKNVCHSLAFHRSLEMKVVPIKIEAMIDRFFPEKDAVEFAKKEIVSKLAEAVADYVEFKVNEDYMYGRKRLEGFIRVLEGEKGIRQEG